MAVLTAKLRELIFLISIVISSAGQGLQGSCSLPLILTGTYVALTGPR